MTEKKFNTLIDELAAVNKATASSVVNGVDPVLAWFKKKRFRFVFGVHFLLFKAMNVHMYRTLVKHPDQFIIRIFYRYFPFNKTFMLKPENWLMTLTTLPSFIMHGDENHLKMKHNRLSKKERERMVNFCKEFHHYGTIESLMKVSEIKEMVLRNRASQIMEMAKLMACQEDENSPQSGNVPEDFVKRLLK